MRIYLDNCCYNRPFDDQSQLRVRLETEAKLRVQYLMRTGTLEYVWSDMLVVEAGDCPIVDQRENDRNKARRMDALFGLPLGRLFSIKCHDPHHHWLCFMRFLGCQEEQSRVNILGKAWNYNTFPLDMLGRNLCRYRHPAKSTARRPRQDHRQMQALP